MLTTITIHVPFKSTLGTRPCNQQQADEQSYSRLELEFVQRDHECSKEIHVLATEKGREATATNSVLYRWHGLDFQVLIAGESQKPALGSVLMHCQNLETCISTQLPTHAEIQHNIIFPFGAASFDEVMSILEILFMCRD